MLGFTCRNSRDLFDYGLVQLLPHSDSFKALAAQFLGPGAFLDELNLVAVRIFDEGDD